ncbi:type II secretion system protein [bacterium]|nr:type II secretion system protein [bacterium]
MFNLNNKLFSIPYYEKNHAFTLAEVLITLVIIGVIAAITVPTLITKYQKEQTVTRLKKSIFYIGSNNSKSNCRLWTCYYLGNWDSWKC